MASDPRRMVLTYQETVTMLSEAHRVPPDQVRVQSHLDGGRTAQKQWLRGFRRRNQFGGLQVSAVDLERAALELPILHSCVQAEKEADATIAANARAAKLALGGDRTGVFVLSKDSDFQVPPWVDGIVHWDKQTGELQLFDFPVGALRVAHQVPATSRTTAATRAARRHRDGPRRLEIPLQPTRRNTSDLSLRFLARSTSPTAVAATSSCAG